MNRTTRLLASVLAVADLGIAVAVVALPDLDQVPHIARLAPDCRRQGDGSHRIEQFDVDTHDTDPAVGGRYIAHTLGGTC